MSLKSSVIAGLELCRVGNLPSIWTNVLASMVLSTGLFHLTDYTVLSLALSAFYLAGMCFNDICDLDCDRIHRPDRPLPSGRISLLTALILTFSLFFSGFWPFLLAPYRQGLYAAFTLFVAIVWYDLRHKKNSLSILLMGFCRFIVYVATAQALTGNLPMPVIIAASVQFAYVFALSAVARLENKRSKPFELPVIPLMLSGICLLDGALLAVFVSPVWFIAGLGGALLMTGGQKLFRGD